MSYNAEAHKNDCLRTKQHPLISCCSRFFNHNTSKDIKLCERKTVLGLSGGSKRGQFGATSPKGL